MDTSQKKYTFVYQNGRTSGSSDMQAYYGYLRMTTNSSDKTLIGVYAFLFMLHMHACLIIQES
jgi:hypothetical protein